MLSPEQLLKVAAAYSRATGATLSTAGRRACNNDKVFVQLEASIAAGQKRAVLSSTIEDATAWFANNWPIGARWPKDVPGGPTGSPRRGPPLGISRKGTRTTAI